MKENEFDIYVRNLMGGAEESVSPDVWKGIEARLDQAAAPKKTVPVWLWRSLGAVAAAAAVVAAVVLTGPEKDLSNQPTINTVASATDETLPEETLPEEDVTPVVEQVSRLRTRTARVWEAPSLDMTEEPEKPLVSEAVVPKDERRPESIIGRPSFNQDESLSADADAFNRLAFEEHKTSSPIPGRRVLPAPFAGRPASLFPRTPAGRASFPSPRNSVSDFRYPPVSASAMTSRPAGVSARASSTRT